MRKSRWRGGTFHVAWTRLQDGRKWRKQEYEIVYSGRSTFPYWEYILKAELGTVKHTNFKPCWRIPSRLKEGRALDVVDQEAYARTAV